MVNAIKTLEINGCQHIPLAVTGGSLQIIVSHMTLHFIEESIIIFIPISFELIQWMLSIVHHNMSSFDIRMRIQSMIHSLICCPKSLKSNPNHLRTFGEETQCNRLLEILNQCTQVGPLKGEKSP